MEISLQLFGLERGLSEGLPKEILRSVPSSVSAVPCDRKHHLLVLFVVRKNLFESVAQIEEVLSLAELRLENFGSHVDIIEVLPLFSGEWVLVSIGVLSGAPSSRVYHGHWSLLQIAVSGQL